MKPETVRSCPVCTEKSYDSLYEINFPIPEIFPLGSRQEIKCCRKCGMVYSDSGDTQADYDLYYNRLSKYSAPGTESVHAKTRFQNTFRLLGPYLKKDFNICDLGCGGGGLLTYFRSSGFEELTGIEAAELSPEVYKDKFSYLRSSLFEADRAARKRFEVLTCIGVVEHLLDVETGIQVMRNLLNTEGILYLEVPDAEKYQDNVIAPFQDFNLEHINHFSSIALRNVLTRHGFETLSLSHIYQPESPLYQMPVIAIIARKQSKTADRALTKEFDLAPAIINYIKKSQLLMDRYDQYIEDELKDISKLIIWGSGQLAVKLSQLPAIKRRTILAFIDRNPSISDIAGVKVLLPDDFPAEDSPILIGSTLHAGSIAADISKRSLPNKVLDLTKVSNLQKP